jgi:hypothetical protein
MQEREQYSLAMTAAETMYYLWQLADQQEEVDLDRKMRRLKDLSAYSLTHAEIMEQREIVELLALGMFFGASSDNRLWVNQRRLTLLSGETVDYQGRVEVVEQEVAARKKAGRRRRGKEDTDPNPLQPQLL